MISRLEVLDRKPLVEALELSLGARDERRVGIKGLERLQLRDCVLAVLGVEDGFSPHLRVLEGRVEKAVVGERILRKQLIDSAERLRREKMISVLVLGASEIVIRHRDPRIPGRKLRRKSLERPSRVFPVLRVELSYACIVQRLGGSKRTRVELRLARGKRNDGSDEKTSCGHAYSPTLSGAGCSTIWRPIE